MTDIHASWMQAQVAGYAHVREKWPTLKLDLEQTISYALADDGKDFSLRHRVTGKADAGDESSVVVGVEIEILIGSKIQTKKEYIEVFVSNSLHFVTRPYIREYFQSALARLGLPSEPLPLVRLGEDA